MLRDHNLISTVRVSKHPETWPHWEECPNFPKNLGIFFGLALSRILGGSNLLLLASRMLPECGIGPLHTSGGCLQMETQRLWRPLWHHSLRYNSSGHCHFILFWVTSKSWCPPSPIHQNFLFHVHLQPPQHLLPIELQSSYCCSHPHIFCSWRSDY